MVETRFTYIFFSIAILPFGVNHQSSRGHVGSRRCLTSQLDHSAGAYKIMWEQKVYDNDICVHEYVYMAHIMNTVYYKKVIFLQFICYKNYIFKYICYLKYI